MKPIYPFNKVLLIACISILSNGLKTSAQSSGNTTWGSGKFLGWTTTRDLPFRINTIIRMTLRDTIGYPGYLGIGTKTPLSMLSVGPLSQFQVNSTGNLIRINGISYSFPSVQGAAGINTVLQNDNGSGTLTWSAGIPGPAGPSGPIGATGAAGPAGPTGPAGFLSNGSTAGNTPYWNGSSWIVNNSNIYNNGGDVGINTTSPLGKLHIKGSTNSPLLIIDAVGTQSNSNPFIKLRSSAGTDLMWIHSDDTTNAFVGLNAGRVNSYAGYGVYNTFIGSNTGSFNTTGWQNTAIGYGALNRNVGGYGNTAIGFEAIYNNQSGNFNTAIGDYVLISNTAGSRITVLGYRADVLADGLINATAIGYNAKVSTSNSLVLGATGSDSVNVGIGTTAPTSRLHIKGKIRIVDGTQAPGKILTSDSNGLASWVSPLMSVGNNPGDMYYWNGSSWILIPIGTQGQVLTVCNGVPKWVPCLTVTTTGGIPSGSWVAGNTASSGGNIINDGETIIAERGLCWDTITNPTITNNHAAYGTGAGVFTGTLTGLIAGKTYHVRAYARTSAGTAYGNDTSFAVPLAIGYVYKGGVIAYLLNSSDQGWVYGEVHGLIAEPLNQTTRCSIELEWGCYGQSIPGADGIAIGSGRQNTIDIVNSCPAANTAARYCYDLVIDGYDDWYLPSKNELNAIMPNAVAIGSVHVYCSNYWSSSKVGDTNAWAQYYYTGLQYAPERVNSGWSSQHIYVRAIRPF